MLARFAALLLAAPALFSAVPAVAQVADAPTAKTKKVVDPNKKVCRTVDTTGSIMMGTRVCHTKAEWATLDEHNSANTASSRDIRGGGGSPRGN